MNREVSHYVVTAHPPGGVLHTVKCNFLAADSEVSMVETNHYIYSLQASIQFDTHSLKPCALCFTFF